MKHLCFRLLLCALTALPLVLPTADRVQAQVQFQVVVGDSVNQRGYSIRQLPDSGYVIAGTYYRPGFGEDVFVARLGKLGNKVWAYYYRINNYVSEGYSVDLASDGGFVVTGKAYSATCCTSEEAFLLKTDNVGVLKWVRTYGGCGGEAGYHVQRTADNGYIIAGRSNSFGAGDDDGYLIKTDMDGMRQWSKVYGDTAKEWLRSVQEVPGMGNGFIAAGFTESYATTATAAPTRQGFAVRTNNDGTLQWACHFGRAGEEDMYSIRSFDGGFVTVGSSDSYTTTRDIFMVKLANNGTFSWAWRYGLALGDDIGYSVKESGNNLIVGAQVTGAGFAGLNAMMMETNNTGAGQWRRIYGGAGDEDARDAIPTFAGGYACTGFTNSFGFGMDDVYVVKTNGTGITPCHITTATLDSANYSSLTLAFVTPKISNVNVECTSTGARVSVMRDSVLCTNQTTSTCSCECEGITYYYPCTNPNTFVCPCDTIVDPPTTTCTCVCNGITYTYPCADPETFVCPCDTIVDPPDPYCTCVCGDSIWTYPCPDPMAAFCPCDTVGGPPSDTTEDWPPPGPTNGGLPGSRYNEGFAGRPGMPSLLPGEQFRVYPNPVEPGESFALVYALDRAGGMTVTVTDMLGRTVDRTVHRNAGRGAMDIRTSGWPKGMYIITVQSAGGVKMLSVMVR